VCSFWSGIRSSSRSLQNRGLCALDALQQLAPVRLEDCGAVKLFPTLGRTAGRIIQRLLGLWAPGWSVQTCNVNSLSRCSSKFRIISSKDLPAGAPEGLKTQVHSEQPQPRKRGRSIHTNSRLMAALVAAPRRCLTPCLVLASGLVCGTKRVIPNV
jgi:hypothetical protein